MTKLTSAVLLVCSAAVLSCNAGDSTGGVDGGKAPVHTVFVPGADHFSVIAPGTEAAAAAILAATAGRPVVITAPDIEGRMRRRR